MGLGRPPGGSDLEAKVKGSGGEGCERRGHHPWGLAGRERSLEPFPGGLMSSFPSPEWPKCVGDCT